MGYNNDDYNTVNENENYNSNVTHKNRKISNNNSLSSHHSNNHNFSKPLPPVANTSPDSGFINTLRYGMLAFRLLPRSNISSKF